jgi:hypothetical protein
MASWIVHLRIAENLLGFIPDIYLSQAEMDRFVSETTQHLLRIYRHLWIQAAETDGLCSALSLSF